MDFTSIQEPAGFDQLTKGDQIRYVQRLWNLISENPYDIPVPPSHLKLAESRLADYRRDPGAARPADELIARLRSKAR